MVWCEFRSDPDPDPAECFVQVVIAVGQTYWTTAATKAIAAGALDALVKANTHELMEEVRARHAAAPKAAAVGGGLFEQLPSGEDFLSSGRRGRAS
eukprot:354987-Chlamydomonas_euryale.AAC.3